MILDFFVILNSLLVVEKLVVEILFDLCNSDRRFFLEQFKQVLSLLWFVTYSPDFAGITCLQEEVKVWGLLLFSVFDRAQGV